MAVYTDVSPEDLESFLESYDLGRVKSYKGIAEGVENSNYLLHLTSGSYILTLYEKRVNQADLPFFIGLMEHLSSKGLNCPLPVQNKKGVALGELAGRPATIVTFLEGLSLRKPTRHQCGELGEALAKLHVAGLDFNIKRQNGLELKDWRPLFELSHARADEVTLGLRALVADELSFLEQNWPKNLPKGVIHADLFLDNVFFLEGHLSGLIDFYFACNDSLAYDLAICLNAWCFTTPSQSIACQFDYSFGKAMIAGYQSVRPLTQEELTALPILARGSALRFLLTRLYDWLNVPAGALVKPKDPLEYLAKLRVHQKITSAGEYGA